MKKKLLQTTFSFIAIFFSLLPVQAQVTNNSTLIALDAMDAPLVKVLAQIENQTNYRFAYQSDLVLKHKNVTFKTSGLTLEELLNSLFKNDHISFSIEGNQVILQEKVLPEKITISGYARDASTGETLIGTSIFIAGTNTGVVSNNYGFYSLTIAPTDTVELIFSYVGYNVNYKKLSARKDQFAPVRLQRKETAVNTFTFINDKTEAHVTKNKIDILDLPTDIVGAGPALSGNGDIFGSVLQTAGVQAGMYGSPGYNVRGGNPDQNLVQLDEATIYNPNHLYGLVGVFNTATIKRASLLKGSFPAQYGDYISSVLDVSMNDGNNQEIGGEVQLGTIASSLVLTGPINVQKASFLLAARRSTIDLLLKPLSVKKYFNDYNFYDLNAKLNYQVTTHDRLFISYYRGADYGNYSVNSNTQAEEEDEESKEQANYEISYGNQAIVLRWNHVYTKKIFSNTSLIYSNYFQRLSAIQQDYYAQLYSGIRDLNARADFYYYPHPYHNIRAGVNYLHQSLFPATISDKISTTGFASIKAAGIPANNMRRAAVYISDDIKMHSRLNLYIGARLPYFSSSGVNHLTIEPRFALLYLLNESSSFKVGYSRMTQFLHLIQSYNAAFPAEIWMGSSKIIKPQTGQQVSAGLFRKHSKNRFQVSLEGYYKQMNNQQLFKGSSGTASYSDIENKIIFGKGWSYGAEISVRKIKGKITGLFSYAFSEAYQLFDSLNNAKKFPNASNRKHSLYFTASYQINKHWRFAANLIVSSGRSFTFKNPGIPAAGSSDDNPLFDEEDDDVDIPDEPENNKPNNFGLTPYNRLDISLSNLKTHQSIRKQWQREWVIAVYNVYAYKNTHFAYRSIDPLTKQASVKQISSIPVIPSIAYKLNF